MTTHGGLIALIMLAGAAPGFGCVDECRAGEGKCLSNTTWTCIRPENEAARWVKGRDCGADFCHSSSYGATCSPTNETDPLCAFTTGPVITNPICDGSVQIDCALGYRVAARQDCLSAALCVPSGACEVVGGLHVVCHALEEPTASVRTACYLNNVMVCREGKLLSLTDCGAGRCTLGPAPPFGAEWCFPEGKCVPYASEPLAVCQ